MRLWDETVLEDTDEVYVLGDFSFYKPEETGKILNRLRGVKHLIAGNHDLKETRNLSGWASVRDYHDLRIDGRKVVLCHYPLAVWRANHAGRLHLHGHCHGSYTLDSTQCVDVGVDCWGFRPVTLAEIDARAATLPPWQPLDCHHPNGEISP
jgi:calcineurin-like phosphoesterase family protein